MKTRLKTCSSYFTLIDRAGNNIFGNNTLDAKIKLMKLAFLAEKEIIEKKYKGFNFFLISIKEGHLARNFYNF